MNQGDFVDWATIVGGFAGLLSFGYVVWEKFSAKPKLILRIRKSFFRLHRNRDKKGKFHVEAGVSLEIGNVGSEATTITEVNLELSDKKVLGSKQRTGDMVFIVDDYNTRLCEKGIAFVEHFQFVGHNFDDDFGKSISGHVILKLLGGTELRHPIICTVEQS